MIESPLAGTGTAAGVATGNLTTVGGTAEEHLSGLAAGTSYVSGVMRLERDPGLPYSQRAWEPGTAVMATTPQVLHRGTGPVVMVL